MRGARREHLSHTLNQPCKPGHSWAVGGGVEVAGAKELPQAHQVIKNPAGVVAVPDIHAAMAWLHQRVQA